MTTLAHSSLTTMSFRLTLRAHQVADAIRSTLARFAGNTEPARAAIVPVIEATHVRDTSALFRGSILVNPLRQLAYRVMVWEAELLCDEYIATLGGDPDEALKLCMNDPDTARAHITAAVQAQLRAVADEVAPAPAQPRARVRL
jgi:hypothetical protein